MICPQCKGAKTICKMGGISGYCPKCGGRGNVNGEPTQEIDGKQNEIACAQNTEAKTDVDKSTPKSSKRIRSNNRKEREMGSGSEDIQESKASGKSDEKGRPKEMKLRPAIPQKPLTVLHMNPQILKD